MDPMPRTPGPVPQISNTFRMERMQRMFDADRAILAEDYEHFSGVKITPDAPTHRSRDCHTSAGSSELQSQEPS